MWQKIWRDLFVLKPIWCMDQFSMWPQHGYTNKRWNILVGCQPPPYMLLNEQVWTYVGGPCIKRLSWKKFSMSRGTGARGGGVPVWWSRMYYEWCSQGLSPGPWRDRVTGTHDWKHYLPATSLAADNEQNQNPFKANLYNNESDVASNLYLY